MVNINNLEKSINPQSFILTDDSNTPFYKNPNTSTYNSITDSIIYFREGALVNYTGDVIGWSNPEGVQWSNVPFWDNRSWEIVINVDTDLIGISTITIPATSYSSFYLLAQAINQALITYGSSFRIVVSNSNDRMFLTQINGTIIASSVDPYFSLHNFSNLELTILDSVTGSDFLVKAVNPKDFTVSNVDVLQGKDLLKGKLNLTDIGSTIPVPILSLGGNYFLQHNRIDDYGTFINNVYTSSSIQKKPSQTLFGYEWSNDNLNVGISYNKGNYNTFLSNNPIIFLEVFSNKGRSNRKKKYNKAQWVHPCNKNGSLHRVGSNYGDGNPASIITEWDFTASTNQEQIIDIDQHGFYINNSISLPQRWVDFVNSSQNQLKYQRGGKMSPTGNPGEYVVNTFIQPIRFRFGYIDPTDGKSVILGNPSEILYIKPKWGYFTPQDDTYIYDWVITFHK